MKNIFKRATALMLSLLMVFSVCSTSLVIYAQDAAQDAFLEELWKSLLEGSESAEKDLVYVSIGDSMTNGYGLDGYDGESGIMNYGKDVYSNQFAAWLAGYTGEIADDQTVFTGTNGTVDHRQLAMSGMRAEDLAWLLQLDYAKMTDDDAKWLVRFKNNVADSNAPWFKSDLSDNKCCKNCYSGECIHGWEYEWGNGREYWYSYDVRTKTAEDSGYGFTTGDWRTWTDLLDPDYRLADGAAKILSMCGKEDFGFVSDSVSVTDSMITTAQSRLNSDKYYPADGLNQSRDLFGAEGRWLRFVAEFYQDSVEDADVITMSLGNTNFGTFMFDTIKDIFLNPNAKNWFPSRYHIDEVYLMAKAAGVDDTLIAMIKDLINNELTPILDEQFGDIANEPLPETVVDGSAVDPYGLLANRTKGALIKYIVEYCVLSYIVSYVATLDRIVALNPNAQIIQIALMNAYKTGNGAEGNEGTSFASIIDQIYAPMNAFIAMLPNYLANKNADAYKAATFYYADCGTVETLSAVFGNDFYTYDGQAITYDAYQAMLANNTLDVSKLGHNDSTVRERFHHWLASSNGCRHSRSGNGEVNTYGAHIYCSDCYLAIEMKHAPGSGTGWGWCDVTSYGEMWKGLLGPLECDWDDTLTTKPQNSHPDQYNDWVANGSKNFIQKFFNKYRLTFVTEADIIAFEKLSAEDKNAKLASTETQSHKTAEGYDVTVGVADLAFSCAMYLAFEDATIRAGKNEFMIDDLTGVSGLGYDTFGGAVELFAEKMGLTGTSIVGAESALATIDAYTLIKNFSDALIEDGPSATMLCLANRMQIGTGIGGHPSEGGHDDMAAALIEQYAAENTGDDVTKAFLVSYLKDKYPDLMDKLGYVTKIGETDDLARIVMMLKLAQKNGNSALAGIDLDAIEAAIRAKLNAYKSAHTLDEQAAAQAAAYDLMLDLQALAAKVTAVDYKVTEDSYYVSLGDSNVNGHNLTGFIPDYNGGFNQKIEGAAPVELAQKLYGEDWEAKFAQYAMGSLRCEDMLYILGTEGITTDEYWDDEVSWRVNNALTAIQSDKTIQEVYYDAIKKADLISIALGGGNVTTFTGEQVDRVTDNDETTKVIKMDWSKIGYTDAAITDLKGFIAEMVPLMDTLGLMNKYVPEDLTISNPAEFAATLLESMLYGYASYNYYYPQVLARIREINPDAKLVIIGMFNPIDDWTMEMNGKIVNIGGIVRNVMEMANIQNLAYALQNGNTTFVDINEAETFLDAKIEAGTEEPTFTTYYKSILEGNGDNVHANENGHACMFEQIYANLTGVNVEKEVEEIVKDFYDILNSNYATTEEKLTMIGKTYALLDQKNALGKYPEVKAIAAIYALLDVKGWITDEQSLDIVLCIYERLLDRKLDDAELKEIVTFCYEAILFAQETVATRIDIIVNIYNILDAHFELSKNNEMLAACKNVAEKLVSEGKLTKLQAYAIVHFVYLAYANDGEINSNEFRVIANLVYYVILGQPKMRRSGFDWKDFTWDKFEDEYGADADLTDLLAAIQQDSAVIGEKTPEQKVEILQDVITAIPEEVKTENKQVGAVTDLVTTLTEKDANGESLLTDEQTAAIIDSAFANLVAPDPEDVKLEDAIANITQTVVENLVGIEPEKFDKVMEAIKDTVSDLGGTEDGESGSGIVIPEITIPEEVKYANELAYILQQEGLIDAEQRGALVKELTSVLFGKTTDPMTLIDNIYAIIYKEGFDIETTVKFVVVIATFAYENRNVAFDYANPYYAQAMAVVLEENKANVISSIGSAKAAINSAIVALGGTPKAAIDTDTAALKAALRAELEATWNTLDEIENVLKNNDLKNGSEYEIQATIAALLKFEDDLYAHANNIVAIATEAGALAIAYIQLALEAINHYAGVAAGIAQDAYNWCVENVNGFVEDYLALVETISTEISTKFDPTVGAAVRDFMINTPADALAIIYTAGADAVEELIDRAIGYGNAVTDAAIDLALVIKKYGVAIYNAIINNTECKKLYNELLGVYDEILALESLIKAPSDIADVAKDIYAQLDDLKAYALDLAGRFYDAAIAAVKADDYLAGAELENAINALVAALATIDDETLDYAEWLGQHAGAMGGALLASLLENWDALYTASWPIIVDKATALYNYVKDYILNYDYDALIQKIIDAAIKIAPDVDAYLYDFFYNNPDKVDAFFREYGDEIVDLSKKYGVAVLAVVGIALAKFGPDMVDYIINNPEEALEGLVAWAEKYGARVADILQVYAEYFGICGAVREELDALEAQLQTLYKQLETAYGDARDRILDEIARVQAKIELINAKLQAVVIAIKNLNAALKYFVSDVVGGYVLVIDAINALDAAIRDLLDSVSDTLADKLAQLMHNGIELTKEFAIKLAHLAVESLIEFAPELDEMLYDYFYNNPDEVVAFFNEYGDEIVELCKKHGDKALGVVALALAVGGTKIAEYIVNNPEEALEGLVAWADKYGMRVIDILQVYAEYLGLCDAVRGEIAVLNAQLEKLKAELKHQYELLQGKVGAEYEKALGYINQLIDMIAKIQAQIDVLQVKLQALIDALYALNDALKQFVKDGVDAIATVQKALNGFADAVRNLVNVLSNDLATQIDELLKKAKDYLNGAYENAIIADYIINGGSHYVAFGDNADVAKEFIKVLNKYIAAAGYGYDHSYSNLAMVDSKISDLLNNLKNNPEVVAEVAVADLISIGYSYDQIAEDTIYILLDLMVKGETAIEFEANWNELLGSEIAVEVSKVLAEIEAELIARDLDQTLTQLAPELANMFLPLYSSDVKISDAVMTALEYFAYYAVEYAVRVPQVIAIINQINPDALVMLNTISNPVSGAAINAFGFELAFGDYLDYVVDIIYVESLALAAINDSVVFVPTTDIETSLTNFTFDDTISGRVLSYIFGNMKTEITTTEDGIAYISAMMEKALNITVDDFLRGDVNGDRFVDENDVIYLLRHTFNETRYPLNQSGDMNGDKLVDENDVIYLLRHTFNGTRYPLN